MKNSNKLGKFAIIISLVNKYNKRLMEVVNNNKTTYEEKKFTLAVFDNHILSTTIFGTSSIDGKDVGDHAFVSLFVNYFEPLSDEDFKANLVIFENQVKNFELETHSIINQTNPKQWLSDEL